MVVCRLRKNREFHLNDNPTSDSLGESGFLAIDNSTPALSGVEFGLADGAANTAGSCSKDCSSSHNSPSVEQLDTGSESEDKVTNGPEDGLDEVGIDVYTYICFYPSLKRLL